MAKIGILGQIFSIDCGYPLLRFNYRNLTRMNMPVNAAPQGAVLAGFVFVPHLSAKGMETLASVARQLARKALAFRYESIPEGALHQSRRALLDMLGVSIGGYTSDTRVILQKVFRQFGGAPEARIIGNGERLAAPYAALVNGGMLRFLDYNDGYANPVPREMRKNPDSDRLAERRVGGGHPSEAIPAILAVAEMLHLPPRDVVTNIVLAYDLLARFSRAVRGEPLENRHFNPDTRGSFIMPIVIGRMLGLNEEQIANAVGISGSQGIVLGVLDASGEPYTMAKNLRFPFTVERSFKAVYLARAGFTGPQRAIEGHRGFSQAVLRGEFAVEDLLEDSDHLHILDTTYKPFAADRTTHGHISCTLHLVRQYNIRAEDVAEVIVRAGSRDIEHTGNPAKRYPTNTESANHSSWYLTAVGILDGRVGPEQYTPERYSDPRVLALMDRVRLEAAPEFDHYYAAGEVTIRLRSGEAFVHRVLYPKGDPLNAMSDGELEAKFADMAAPFLPAARIREIFDVIWSFERRPSLNELLDRLVFDPQ